ncbi:MAG TPA: DeoR/GlpR family DNA-binding transcription regulator [Puia sp.]|jgi:DeoR family fructose operon transcriptional repressor
MNAQKRKQLILARLEKTGDVEIKPLATELQTSEITIRRDLNQLAGDGRLYRTHGGAMKVNPLEGPHNFVNKSAIHSAAKDSIARRAAAEIRDGDIIFLDCGSTVSRICPFIRNKTIKVITNSLPILYELQNSRVSINLIGGEFDQERQAVHGKMAEFHIRKYRASKAFVGADGISPKGLFANGEKEASMTLALAGQSGFTYLLCDAGKIDRETYWRFAETTLADALITDYDLTKLKYLKKAGLRLIAAP